MDSLFFSGFTSLPIQLPKVQYLKWFRYVFLYKLNRSSFTMDSLKLTIFGVLLLILTH